MWQGSDSSTSLSPPGSPTADLSAQHLLSISGLLLNCCAQKSKVSQGRASPWLCSLVCFSWPSTWDGALVTWELQCLYQMQPLYSYVGLGLRYPGHLCLWNLRDRCKMTGLRGSQGFCISQQGSQCRHGSCCQVSQHREGPGPAGARDNISAGEGKERRGRKDFKH